MGKKKTKSASKNGTASKRKSRKEPYDTKRLNRVIERLREQAQRLATLSRSMDDSGIDDITTDGHAMLLRGLNQVDNFADNASRAVREAKTAKYE
ncbi:MAG: hypothetical protein ACKVH8_22935 [Pirellulales bacterium]|jgi:hypothetical protein